MRIWSRVFYAREFYKRLSKVSPTATELYGLITDSCDWKYGRYVATRAEVAEILNVSERSIQRANKELEAVGLIKFKRGIYAINPEFNWGGGVGIYRNPVTTRWTGKVLKLLILMMQQKPLTQKNLRK